jgi:hypothetical protein
LISKFKKKRIELKKKINQGKDKIQKKIAIKIIGTKYDK